MITNEWIFSTQVFSLITFVVALFVLYRILVQQKDATIQLQKENIAFLKDQLAETQSRSPDALAQILAGRVKILEEEVKRMHEDKSSTQEQVAAKEGELKDARQKAEDLTRQVLHARESLRGFLCPHCGAPLSERAYHSESVEYQGRELDVDHEYTAYECGYEIVDGKPSGKCKHASVNSATE